MVQDIFSQIVISFFFVYYVILYDVSVKMFLFYFGSVVVVNVDVVEYSNYIDIIFQQFDMGKFICWKLY